MTMTMTKSSSPIRTVTHTCTVSSLDSLEHLLLQTAAALCQAGPVDYVVVDAASSSSSTSVAASWTTVTYNAWAGTTTSVTHTGWRGAVRALLLLWQDDNDDATTTTLALVESWLEATALNLVQIVTQKKKNDPDGVLDAAVQDFAAKLETHLTKTSDKKFLLDDDVPHVIDALVVTALCAAAAQAPTVELPPQVTTWIGTILTRLETLLPFTVIPSWREFGLQRCNCWNTWVAQFGGGATANAATAAATAPATPTATAAAAALVTPSGSPAKPAVASASAANEPTDNVILQKLKEFNIPYEWYAHELCMTAEELLEKVPLPSERETHTKNLFLRDKKHGHFLVTVHPSSHVNTKELGKLLGLAGKTNLRLADEAILDAKLHVKPGCVGPLGMALATPSEDEKEQVKFVLDARLAATTANESSSSSSLDYIHSHPLSNDQSVKVTPAHLMEYLKKAGVEPIILEFDEKKEGDAAKPAAGAGKPKEKGAGAAKKAGAQPKKDAGKKGETKLALSCGKQENFAQWYTDVIVLSEMISYYDISGCYILRPWSYKMWELVQDWFNGQIQKLGVENAYFPLFVSQERLEKEKDHVEGFAPEVAWVTKSGSGDLAKPIAVRPTSETIMYPAFSDWIQSHRDLPLRLNQWSNVVRWEFKYPTPFLRTREFLWQEGHTAHSTFEEAEKMVMDALDLYRRVYEELMAVPVVPGYKTEKEKFAGGYRTTTVEAYIAGSGRAIQGATSHHLGQNFGKMFDITFQDEKGATQTAWQTSWGLTTRTIGVMVMVHGDDTGLVLPPRVAPLQVVIVPIYSKKLAPEVADPYCNAILADLQANGIRAKFDDRSIYNPGWKYNHWEQRGVPIRIEVGPRDVENKAAAVAIRHSKEKMDMPLEGMGAALVTKLEEIQNTMFAKAKAARDGHIVKVMEWKDLVPNLEKNNLVLTPWCGGEHSDWEEHVKEKSREESLKARGEEAEDEKTSTSVAAKSLCIPFDQPELPAGTKCLVSGMDATCWILWGRSY